MSLVEKKGIVSLFVSNVTNGDEHEKVDNFKTFGKVLNKLLTKSDVACLLEDFSWTNMKMNLLTGNESLIDDLALDVLSVCKSQHFEMKFLNQFLQ